jgi:hypothetical protein
MRRDKGRDYVAARGPPGCHFFLHPLLGFSQSYGLDAGICLSSFILRRPLQELSKKFYGIFTRN